MKRHKLKHKKKHHHKHHLRAHVYFARIHHHHPHRRFFVNPISTSVPVQAVVAVTDNNAPITPDSVSWSTNNGSVATVDATSGVVTPVGAGMCQIIADCTVTTPGGTKSVQGVGVVTVTLLGDNLVATVDFLPIAA